MPDNHIPLRTLFTNLQKQMRAKLDSARECILHQGVKGDTSEECWREMLSSYLPKRYSVDKAFVIDHKGRQSDQIDVVIYDRQYSPFIFRQDSAIFVPAESVYAVIEAKQELDKGMIEYAAEKAHSVRRLQRTNANFMSAHGAMKRSDVFPIAAGIVALSSTWKPPLGKAFQKTITAIAAEPLQRLDFGCAVNGGAFDISYSKTGQPSIACSGGPMTLMEFFLKLLSRLQGLGTVPAIEIAKYLEAIEKPC